MRTSRKKLYDALYYGFERKLNILFLNARKCIEMMRVKADREFYETYKNTVVPYWAQYGVKPHIWWYKQFYLRNIPLDRRLIPNDLHLSRIIPYFNNDYFLRLLPDKNLHDLLFAGVKRPETVFKYMDGYYCNDDRSPISKEEALARCAQEGDYIIKPTLHSSSGSDIQFFSGGPDTAAVEKLTAVYGGDDYIVQKCVAQHPELARLNPTSLNTVRFITLALPTGTRILSSVLRVGGTGSRVDNVSKGGYQCTILPDGTLDKLAYTHNSGINEYVEQTQSGVRFEGYPIPAWEKLRDTALNLATRLPHLRYVGWDFAVDEQGDVVLVEFNSQAEQNQGTCGPTFGDMTDEVLTMIFGRKKK